MNCGGSASNNYSHRLLGWDASLTDRKNLTLGAGPAGPAGPAAVHWVQEGPAVLWLVGIGEGEGAVGVEGR